MNFIKIKKKNIKTILYLEQVSAHYYFNIFNVTRKSTKLIYLLVYVKH